MPDKKDTSLDQYDFASPEVTSPEATPLAPEVADAPAASGPPPKGAGGKFISPRLVEQAKRLGVPDEEIAELDNAGLRETIRDTVLEQALSRRETDIHAKLQTNPEPQVAPPVQNEPEAFDWGKGEDGKAFTAEDYPEVTRTLVKLVQELKAKVAEQGSKLGQVYEHVNGQFQKSLADQADAEFAKHESIFGKDKVDDISKDSPEFRRRQLVIAEMNRDEAKAPLIQKLQKAITTIFGVGAKTPAEPIAPPIEPEPKPSKNGTPPEAILPMTPTRWNAGVTAAPSNRNGAKEPKGVGAAKKAFQAGINERNAVLAAAGEHDESAAFDE